MLTSRLISSSSRIGTIGFALLSSIGAIIASVANTADTAKAFLNNALQQLSQV